MTPPRIIPHWRRRLVAPAHPAEWFTRDFGTIRAIESENAAIPPATTVHAALHHTTGSDAPRVSIVLPCLNEATAVGGVVAEARRGLAAAGVTGEVVVVDNGSTDGSADLAWVAGARVLVETTAGYGAALRAGIAHAAGEIVVMADADGTYDLANVGALLAPLDAGADLVIGARLQGTIAAGAMPGLHRYLGTPVLSRALAVVTGVRLADSQSGYRAFRREAMLALGLRARGMEFASEMVVRASRAELTIVEVPTDYRVRVGASKLAPLGDGWRHVRLLLFLAPQWSLLAPGLVAALLGLIFSSISLVADSGLAVGEGRWLPVFLGPMLLILGVQATFLGCLAAHRSPLTPPGLRARLAWLDRSDATSRLLGGFAVAALAGGLLDLGLFWLWLVGQSGPAWLGVAGLAQALIVIGLSGIATVIASEYLAR